eukprot:363887-Chlamydomonas_euryale.AAC.20
MCRGLSILCRGPSANVAQCVLGAGKRLSLCVTARGAQATMQQHSRHEPAAPHGGRYPSWNDSPREVDTLPGTTLDLLYERVGCF